MGYDKQKLEEVFDDPEFQELIKNNDWEKIMKKGYFDNGIYQNNLASFIIQELKYPLLEQLDKIPGYCFYGDENIQGDFVIPSSVESIHWNAFRKCNNLKNIIIPQSVTSIREGAFYLCKNLTSITIPSSVVTSIGSFVFRDCTGLKSVTIESNMIRIKRHAFFGCRNIRDVYYKGTQEEFENIVDPEGNEFLLNSNFHQI